MSPVTPEYRERVRAIHEELGIPVDYEERTGLSLVAEATELVAVLVRNGGPEKQLLPTTAARWAKLEAAAEQDGVRLILLSGFRSVSYQRELILRKLQRNESMTDILRVLAAPGYSEHHSGRAVDIGTPGCEPLSEAFEETDAFAWLQRRAPRMGFYLSYPRDNPNGIMYEPWHWALDARLL